jgi:hypothetical protein
MCIITNSYVFISEKSHIYSVIFLKSDTKNTFSVKYYRFAMLNVCEDMTKIRVELVSERVRVGKGTC